jgi:hypothetical protein
VKKILACWIWWWSLCIVWGWFRTPKGLFEHVQCWGVPQSSSSFVTFLLFKSYFQLCYPNLVGGIPTPLKKLSSSVGIILPNMEK